MGEAADSDTQISSSLDEYSSGEDESFAEYLRYHEKNRPTRLTQPGIDSMESQAGDGAGDSEHAESATPAVQLSAEGKDQWHGCISNLGSAGLIYCFIFTIYTWILLGPREEYLQTYKYDQQTVRRREAARGEEDDILSDIFAVHYELVPL